RASARASATPAPSADAPRAPRAPGRGRNTSRTDPLTRSALELHDVVALDLADALVGAEERVPRHVGAVAARRRMSPQALGERADVVRSRAAADAEVTDAEPIGLAPEVEDLPAGAQEGVEPDRKGALIPAAGIGERHEGRLPGCRAIGHRQPRHVTLHGGADLLEHRQHRRGSAVAVEPNHVRPGILET